MHENAFKATVEGKKGKTYLELLRLQNVAFLRKTLTMNVFQSKTTVPPSLL